MTKAASPLDKLVPNPDWASLPIFDRKGWKRVMFGDVVRLVKDTVKDPEEAGIERFIAMEHLEPGSLHVREWGSVADGTTFRQRCAPGHVLFGKRRAYQRKVAVAEFEAVVSGDIYVLAPKGERLLPELLPFLCLSERFFQHAVGTSAGSLSPRTNWKQLATFEFNLPPLDRQRRIAEILRAVDEYLAKSNVLVESLLMSRKSKIEEILAGDPEGAPGSAWPRVAVEEACERVSVGIVIKPTQYYRPAGIPTFRSANVRRGRVEDSDWVYISEDAHLRLEKSRLHAGDVLVVRSGANAGMSCVVPRKYDNTNCIDIVFATPDQRCLEPNWLSNFINSSQGQIAIKAGERGLAQKHFGVAAMKSITIPLPPLSEQQKHLHEIAEIDRAADALRSNKLQLSTAAAALSDKIFS